MSNKTPHLKSPTNLEYPKYYPKNTGSGENEADVFHAFQVTKIQSQVAVWVARMNGMLKPDGTFRYAIMCVTPASYVRLTTMLEQEATMWGQEVVSNRLGLGVFVWSKERRNQVIIPSKTISKTVSEAIGKPQEPYITTGDVLEYAEIGDWITAGVFEAEILSDKEFRELYVEVGCTIENHCNNPAHRESK